MKRVPSGQYRHRVSFSLKYRVALRLKKGKPHQSLNGQRLNAAHSVKKTLAMGVPLAMLIFGAKLSDINNCVSM